MTGSGPIQREGPLTHAMDLLRQDIHPRVVPFSPPLLGWVCSCLCVCICIFGDCNAVVRLVDTKDIFHDEDQGDGAGKEQADEQGVHLGTQDAQTRTCP